MFANLSIRKKFLVPGLGALLIFVAAITVFWTQRYAAQLEQGFSGKIALSETYIIPPLAEGVWNFNEPMIESALLGLDAFDAFVFAKVLNNGDLIAERQKVEELPQEWLSAAEELQASETEAQRVVGDLLILVVPIMQGEEQLGDLVWGFSRAQLEAQLAESQTIAASIGGMSFAAFALLLFWVAGSVSRPIGTLIAKIKALQSGDTSIEVPEAVRRDEIGQLGQAIETFRASIVETEHLRSEQEKTAEAHRIAEQEAAEQKLMREKEAKEREAARQKAEADRLEKEAEATKKRAAEQKRIADETQLVVGRLGNALAMLSHGRLDCAILENFPEEYESLRRDFNAAVEKLQASITTTLQKTEGIRGDVGRLPTQPTGWPRGPSSRRRHWR